MAVRQNRDEVALLKRCETLTNTNGSSLSCYLSFAFWRLTSIHIAAGNPLPTGITIGPLHVQKKSARTLSVFRDGKQIKTYRIGLDRNLTAAKQEETTWKRQKECPRSIAEVRKVVSTSAAHLLPRDWGQQPRWVRGVSADSDIMIYGIRNDGWRWIGDFHRCEDWTAGCIAATDEEIEELWRVTPGRH